MAAPYTLKKLTDVEDSAAGFGFGHVQEARFAKDDLDSESTGVSHHRLRVAPGVIRAFEAGPDGIEMLAFGPRHDGDGEVIQDWWKD